MKIALVSVEDGIMCMGFRKICAYIKSLHADTKTYYVSDGKYRSLRTMILARSGESSRQSDEEKKLARMAEELGQADLIGLSSMTGYADQTKRLIHEIRKVNPKAYIVWGGIHPIIVPEDAIQHADAICTGEGEFAFRDFFEHFRNGSDYTGTKNFWFNSTNGIIKNGFLPLMTSKEMSSLPLPAYGTDELIFSDSRMQFVEMTPKHYLEQNGLSYNAIWSIGCPFKCTYCGNTKFIENDNAYRKMRYSSVRHIVDEIKQAVSRHPFISTVVFHDDSFMALPYETLAEFADKYKKEVDVPFCVTGVIPNYVCREKVEILLSAGMNRVRMGIQNGSQRILEFYDRPSPPARILEAARVLSDYKRYMIPPAYDIILDNPVETKEDVVANLEFLYKLARPFTLNIYSLRAIPNTILEKQMKERKISLDAISSNYTHNAPSLANCLIYLLAIGQVPRFVFEFFKKRAVPLMEPQPLYPILNLLFRIMYLTKRAFDHLRFMDFSVITGRTGYVLWRTGFIRAWNRAFVPKFVCRNGTAIPKPTVAEEESVKVE